MKSRKTYVWQGHHITVEARASAKYLWLDSRFEVTIDDHSRYVTRNPFLSSSHTRFKIPHEGKHTYGQVVASGFPCTPLVTQSTIVDDSIIGYSQLWIKNRWLTYCLLISLVYLLLH